MAARVFLRSASNAKQRLMTGVRLYSGQPDSEGAREPRSPGVASAYPEPTFTLRTLCWDRLTPEDYISLPGRFNGFRVRIAHPTPPSGDSGGASEASSAVTPSETSSGKWPGPRIVLRPDGAARPPGLQHRDLRGFLYYWRPPPTVTPLAGELRFRITASDNPSSLHYGKNYAVRNSGPWRLSLLCIAWRIPYAPLRKKLLEEGLVDAGTMKLAGELGKVSGIRRQSALIVHSFFQPFIIDLREPVFKFYFLGRKTLQQCLVPNMVSFRPGPTEDPVRPFVGKLRCCFEAARDPSDDSKRTVVMRVLSVIGRPTFAEGYQGSQDLLLPSAGALVPTYRISPEDGKISSHPWSVDVDTDHEEMRVLFAPELGADETLRRWQRILGKEVVFRTNSAGSS
ncbi:hypothetical protein OH77DRAFT_1487921 [Trametes cingulata]|nr:hypothetical protein OH77DRAFT_1487921 [Trametes cingulata]